MEYRLNKYISSSGFCSRREADKHIEDGHVSINGRRAHVGQSVCPGQKVHVSGVLIENEIEPVYIAFNKPVGVVSTTDSSDRNNMVDFIKHEQRIFPIGRLDKDSQGLILLTNDGDIVNKILRAGNRNKKEYIVTIDRTITPEFLKGMAGGVPILDRVTRKCEIEQINPNAFKITLIQGLNRQIRRMCEYFHYNVTKLERTKVMNVELGKLGQGNWRNLTHTELEVMFSMLEDAENEAETKANSTKKASPSTIKHKAKRAKVLEEKMLKDMSARRKKKEQKEQEELEGVSDTPRSRRGNPRAKRTTIGSGERIGKQRADKIARRQRTQERKRPKKK